MLPHYDIMAKFDAFALRNYINRCIATLPRSVLVRFADDFVLLSGSEEMAVWSLDVARRSLENAHRHV